jgi:hypothetical protein
MNNYWYGVLTFPHLVLGMGTEGLVCYVITGVLTRMLENMRAALHS